MRIYLLASFPSLSFTGNAPFTFGAYFSDCARQLSQRNLMELDAVCSEPPEGHTDFARDWAAAWRRFNSANIRERTARLPLEAPVLQSGADRTPPDKMRSEFNAAWEDANPLSRETSLLRAQWNWIEDRRRAAPLSLTDLLGYALQLKILLRKDSWEESSGQSQFETHTQAFLDPVIEELRSQELSA